MPDREKESSVRHAGKILIEQIEKAVEPLADCITAILRADDRCNAELFGSAVLIDVTGEVFLCTTKHVIDRGGPCLFIDAPDENKPLTGTFRSSEKYDVAVLKLNAEQVTLFQKYRPLDADRIATHSEASDCKYAQFIGFPEKKNRRRHGQTQTKGVKYSNGCSVIKVSTTKVHLRFEKRHSVMLFKAAKRDGFVSENPVEFVEPLKSRDNDEAGRRPLTIPEIRAVLAVADPEWQSLIKFGLYTGQRLGDLARLTFANIDLDQDVIRLVTGKTGKRLAIPIARPLRGHLESLSWPDDPKAPIHPRAFQIISDTGRVVSLSNAFVELLAQTGLREIRNHQGRGIGREAKRERPQVSFHSLRHSAVSILKAAGIPHATVQELIGHESEAVSRHYTHVDEKALKKAAKAFPKL